jgi:hypothetical protein
MWESSCGYHYTTVNEKQDCKSNERVNRALATRTTWKKVLYWVIINNFIQFLKQYSISEWRG